MRRTVKTSPLFLEARAAAVRERLPLFLDAIAQRNFAALAELTMRESNELHALCLDTWPPAVYLNETSFAIINFVHAVNAKAGRCVVIKAHNLTYFGPYLVLLHPVPAVRARFSFFLTHPCHWDRVPQGDNHSGDIPTSAMVCRIWIGSVSPTFSLLLLDTIGRLNSQLDIEWTVCICFISSVPAKATHTEILLLRDLVFVDHWLS